jgi:EamA domain-containing membrane protein RarD
LDAISLPPGYRIAYTGLYVELDRAAVMLAAAAVAALLLMSGRRFPIVSCALASSTCSSRCVEHELDTDSCCPILYPTNVVNFAAFRRQDFVHTFNTALLRAVL